MYDRLVLIEGPSDEAIIRELASLMKVNFSTANVGFVPMGGVRNFTHYAAESTLSFLTKRRVGIWLLIDKDEKNDMDVQNLQKLFDDKAKVKILGKREIENYLINVRAISKFINFKKQSGGRTEDVQISDDELNAAIEEVAESLKSTTIDKHVAKILMRPIYPSQKNVFSGNTGDVSKKIDNELGRMIHELGEIKSRTEAVYREQAEQIGKIWNDQKLNLVQGDFLIDLVCQKFGVRFKKERDAARLASFMREEDIDPSLKSIIREISASAM